MKELTVNIQDEYEGKVIYRTELYTEEEYKQLKKENRKLKEYNGELIENHKKDIAILYEENKKLREENDRLKNNAMEDMRVQTKLEDRIKELEQCNLNLQTWLDNKENVNKSLREENSNLKDELQEWLNAVGNM